MGKPARGSEIPAKWEEDGETAQPLDTGCPHRCIFSTPCLCLGVLQLVLSQAKSEYGSGAGSLQGPFQKAVWTTLHQTLFLSFSVLRFCTLKYTPHTSQLPLPRTFNTISISGYENTIWQAATQSQYCFRYHELKHNTHSLNLGLTI